MGGSDVHVGIDMARCLNITYRIAGKFGGENLAISDKTLFF